MGMPGILDDEVSATLPAAPLGILGILVVEVSGTSGEGPLGTLDADVAGTMTEDLGLSTACEPTKPGTGAGAAAADILAEYWANAAADATGAFRLLGLA